MIRFKKIGQPRRRVYVKKGSGALVAPDVDIEGYIKEYDKYKKILGTKKREPIHMILDGTDIEVTKL